jgi:DNA polymerase-3 subunit delta'
MSVATSIWDGVVGQAKAVERLRRAAEQPVHAYLFVGPAGSTKRQAARAFAAALLTGTDDPTSRDADLALRGEHPDVREVERAGPAISADQAREIVRTSSLAPTEGDIKVMILDEFHLLRPEGDLVTISSRCARVDFRTIADADIAERLVAEGVHPSAAAAAAKAATGNIERARVLAVDPALGERRAAFAEVPRRIDGHGNTVMKLVDDLLARIDAAAEPLTERHATEVEAMDERIAQYGERGSGKKALDDRHKRELRRHRTDELRSGLTVIAATYRDVLAHGAPHRVEELSLAVTRIHEAIEALEHNPNEPLLLQHLLWSLPSL